MAITDIKKLNVRSPYFIEVVDEYFELEPDETPDPQPDPITTPIVTIEDIECSSVIHFGISVGTKKFKLDTTGRSLGAYSFTLNNIKTPIKYRVYTEGGTEGSFATAGLDTFAISWLEETGEDDSSLSSEATYPDGVTQVLTYTTTSVTAAVSKNIIVELVMPLITVGNMSITSTSCQALVPAVSPFTSDFVTVLTIETINPILLKTSNQAGNPVLGSASDLTITLNGTSYSMPIGASGGDGAIRIVFSDASPLLAPTTNNWIYSPASRNADYFSDTIWTIQAPTFQMPILHVDETAINEDLNTLVISTPFGVTWGGFVALRSHPVVQEGGNNIIRTLYDGGDNFAQSYLKGTSNHYLWESPMEHTIKFKGGNTQNIVSTTVNRMSTEITYNNGYTDLSFENIDFDNRVVR